MSQTLTPHSPSSGRTSRRRCPVNGKLYGTVGIKTVLHHVRSPWQAELPEQGYYFCDDPGCEVVYFGEDDRVILHSALRSSVWCKDTSPERLLCYCFGVHHGEALADARARAFVARGTKAALCACEIRNPSGRCCLKDFPRQ